MASTTASSEASTGEWWSQFRAQMPAAAQWAYFDHAAVAPLPEPTRRAIIDYANSFAESGVTDWTRWRDTVESARQAAARLIGAAADEIALVHSTTEGIGLVAEGFPWPWQPGDNVVLPANEFPSNLFPWMHLKDRGVETRLVPVEDGRLSLDQIAAACDERTRVVSVSWVGYASGWRTDLAALCELVHSKGACLFVDAIQGLGAFPLDVSCVPIDFLAADGHKWLLGPEGAGIFYVRRDRLDMLRPLGVGWNSVRQAGEFSSHQLDFKPSAGRYEGGTYNIVGIAGLAASLELLLGCGMDRIAERILEVTDQLTQRLRSAGCQVVSDRTGESRSGIVAVDVPGVSPLEFKRRSRAAGVIVNSRDGHVRLSPHAYCSDDDIDRLIALVNRPA